MQGGINRGRCGLATAPGARSAAAGQVPWTLAGFLVAGAVHGARLGAWLSLQVRTACLRYALGALTTVLAVPIWLDLLGWS